VGAVGGDLRQGMGCEKPGYFLLLSHFFHRRSESTKIFASAVWAILCHAEIASTAERINDSVSEGLMS
jgi:hypothetical protein